MQKILRYFEALIWQLIDQSSIHSLLLSFELGMKKLVSWSSDGCSTILGKKGAITRKLQQISPSMIPFHCPTHRLDLVIQDIVQEV